MSCHCYPKRFLLLFIVSIIISLIIGLSGLTGSFILPNKSTTEQWLLGIIVNLGISMIVLVISLMLGIIIYWCSKLVLWTFGLTELNDDSYGLL